MHNNYPWNRRAAPSLCGFPLGTPCSSGGFALTPSQGDCGTETMRPSSSCAGPPKKKPDHQRTWSSFLGRNHVLLYVCIQFSHFCVGFKLKSIWTGKDLEKVPFITGKTWNSEASSGGQKPFSGTQDAAPRSNGAFLSHGGTPSHHPFW